jgi:hypothetical protein
MVQPVESDNDQVYELSEEEAWAMIEERTRAHFGLSAREFIETWLSGGFGDADDDPDALEIAVLLPGVGVNPWANAERA